MEGLEMIANNNSFPGFNSSSTGLTKRPNLTREDWEKVGRTIAEMDNRWQWYIGDWLLAGEEGGYVERGKHKEACALFGISYSTSANTANICKSLSVTARREHLSFSHHAEVANRTDAEELLDWCEETEATRKQLRAEKKKRDAAASEEGVTNFTTPPGKAGDVTSEEDTDFDFGANVEGENPPPPEPEIVLTDNHNCRIPTALNDVFIQGPPAIKALMNKISAIKKEIQEAVLLPGCSIIPITATDVFLKDTRNALKNASPKWVCTCRGAGCSTCDHRGWLQEHCGVLFDDQEDE